MRITEYPTRYMVINDESQMDVYNKENVEDLNILVQFLLDEYYKAEEKQSTWFKKYWELKRKINQITDIVNEED